MENNKFIKVLARIIYFILRPFVFLRSKYVQHICTYRLRMAKRRAIHEASVSGHSRYVVFAHGKFYVYNKGGMMALAKAYRKQTGLSTDWRKLYVFEAKVATEAAKAEAKRKAEEDKA